MYEQDIEIARHINNLQQQFGWPQRIVTSTGKNAKEKILSCIDLLNGALTMTASVQSTSPVVLRNINRQNVSIDVLMKAARGNGGAHKSYSEIILGLPGDSYERHLQTIKDMVDCCVNELAIVQLMILPDTPMGDPSYIERFGMTTRYRLLVKGFAQVQVGEQRKTVIEHEEICVATAEMPFNDYLRARVADLLVHVFYNNVLSTETFDLFKGKRSSVFEYLRTLIELRKPANLQRVLDRYVQYLHDELFESREAIETFLEQGDVYERLQAGEIGKNATYVYGKEAVEHFDELLQVASEAAQLIGNDDAVRLIENDLRGRYLPGSMPALRQPA